MRLCQFGPGVSEDGFPFVSPNLGVAEGQDDTLAQPFGGEPEVTGEVSRLPRSHQLRPPWPDHPVADLSPERIKRRPVLRSLKAKVRRASGHQLAASAATETNPQPAANTAAIGNIPTSDTHTVYTAIKRKKAGWTWR